MIFFYWFLLQIPVERNKTYCKPLSKQKQGSWIKASPPYLSDWITINKLYRIRS